MDYENAVRFKKMMSHHGQDIRERATSLLSKLKLPSTKHIIRLQALLTICCNTLAAYDMGIPVAYFRDRSRYSIPDRYGASHYTYDMIVPTIDALIDAGYLHSVNGYYCHDNLSNSRSARTWGSHTLYDFFEEAFTGPEYMEYSDPIILKLGSKNNRYKRMIDYRDNKQTRAMRRFLKEYNTFINSTSIGIITTQVTNPGGYVTTPYTEAYPTSGTITQTESTNISDKHLGYRPLHCPLHRIFNTSTERGFKWNHGGRFYGGEYQTLPKSERKNIVINGQHTVELDYSGQHLRMLYNGMDIDYIDDPYIAVCSDQDMRPLMKTIALIAINADSRRKALGAITKHVNDVKAQCMQWPVNSGKQPLWLLKLNTAGKGAIAKYYDAFITAHKPISKYLNSGVGLKLQYSDSMIAEQVLRHFTDRGIPCLCIHDSFIVPEQYQSELKQVMLDEYMRQFHYPINIEVA